MTRQSLNVCPRQTNIYYILSKDLSQPLVTHTKLENRCGENDIFSKEQDPLKGKTLPTPKTISKAKRYLYPRPSQRQNVTLWTDILYSTDYMTDATSSPISPKLRKGELSAIVTHTRVVCGLLSVWLSNPKKNSKW